MLFRCVPDAVRSILLVLFINLLYVEWMNLCLNMLFPMVKPRLHVSYYEDMNANSIPNGLKSSRYVSNYC